MIKMENEIIMKEISNVENELKSIFDNYNVILGEQYQKILPDILNIFERECSESYMQGYRYAISILEDSIVKRGTEYN